MARARRGASVLAAGACLALGLGACEREVGERGTAMPRDEHARATPPVVAERGGTSAPLAPAPDTHQAESAGAPLSADERADLALLDAIVGERFDAVEEALIPVDDAVERDLPVRASQLIETSVLPASRGLVRRLGEIELRSELGASLRRSWLEAYQAREETLVAYADALGRGIVEDLTLADALRDQRRAAERVASARAAHAAARRRVDASGEGE